MTRGLAYRRRQARKAKNKAFHFLTKWWGISDIHWIPSNQQVGLWTSTHCCPCSCIMCGNKRKLEGPTRQEILAELSLKEQSEDYLYK